MGTIAEMAVRIGADTGDFEQSTKRMQNEVKNMGTSVTDMARTMGQSAVGFTDSWRLMSEEMKASYQESYKKLIPFEQQQKEVEYGFFKMAQGMSEYKGTTQEFMGDLNRLGTEHKKIADNIVKNSDFMKQGFIQSIATMQARSTQSEKIAQNFDRMNNPLYKVNNGLLKVTQGMEEMAKKGQPAYLALKMLGPTANMKELRDMTMLINRGLMRFTMVALVAAVGAGIFYGALHKAASSVPGYTESFEKMGATLREAFQPMVEVFAAVMMKVYGFITIIGQLMIKFNEAHPVLAKVLQGFLLLIPALILLLSPLAIGVGLIAGMQAAFTSVWMLISPLVTGLGAMMGTVLLVAAAIALIGVALWALWTKTTWFKDVVLTVWENIKTATQMAWNWIMNNVITPILTAIQSFIQEKMAQVASFWSENGQMILQAGQNVWSVLSTIIQAAVTVIGAVIAVAFPIAKAIVIATWNAIKLAISGAIDIILGVIKFFAALFTGNWDELWKATQQILKGAVKFLLGFIQLSFFGGITKGITALASSVRTLFTSMWTKVGSVFTKGATNVGNIVKTGLNKVVSFINGLKNTFFNAGKGLIEMMAKGITNAASKVLNAVKDLAGKARDFLPFSPAKEGPLSDLDKLDFGNPIADSITKAVPTVQDLMSKMLTMPTIKADSFTKSEGNKTLNFEKMFEGAVFTVRDDSDIRKIGEELGNSFNDRLAIAGMKLR